MEGAEKRNSFGHTAVLAGLWFINLLILIFGLPFLIFKKVQELFAQINKKSRPETKSETARYFPCRN